MSKRQILILIVTFVLVVGITSLLVYLFSGDKVKLAEKEKNYLEVGEYKLEYGDYTGIEKEYDYDTDTMKDNVIILTLSSDNITINNISSSYKVKGTSIYVNEVEMYKVLANNKFVMQAGAGVEFEYGKK